ncbi:hypothetical protein POM88_000268 [Heracleum sosnowskyi]|uniref:SLC26A/SulP transporter domain-containing protein n=1 Tax=Heracleum sosnowskyi TaxID=360622 RepID=A0AAD8JCP2_9APIA|nr:hypothetical protein POM88_000268 [Heracleum sosnowskyi]
MLSSAEETGQVNVDTNVVPPIIYAFMGSSREIAIGPVAVVSLLISSMVQKLQDPEANPVAYRNLVFTVTLYTGIFQATFGLLRLGFLVDFLSHAVIVGFMAGAAIVIGLQQLKGLLGITYSTNKTDIIYVLAAVFKSLFHNPWSHYNFVLGCSFLCFLLLERIVGRRNKKLFWLPAIAPLFRRSNQPLAWPNNDFRTFAGLFCVVRWDPWSSGVLRFQGGGQKYKGCGVLVPM